MGSIDKHIYAVDASNGQLKWKFKTNGKVTGSPEVANKKVYFTSQEGGLFAVQ